MIECWMPTKLRKSEQTIGPTPFAALMDLTMVGDFVSLHLAALNGSDPCADTFISKTLKAGLKPPRAAKG
jgi:hypothetical protein